MGLVLKPKVQDHVGMQILSFSPKKLCRNKQLANKQFTIPKINGVIQLPFSQTYYQVLVPNTVDGRNPAPVEVGSFSHYLKGFSTIPGGCLGFLNHQQYVAYSYQSLWSTMF